MDIAAAVDVRAVIVLQKLARFAVIVKNALDLSVIALGESVSAVLHEREREPRSAFDYVSDTAHSRKVMSGVLAPE